jgi:ATP-dependent protease ClpP protease subunit
MTPTAPATVIRLADEIGGSWGIAPGDVLAELGAARGDVRVELCSPGGDAFGGLAIYAALRRHPGLVTVVVEGLAASIATVIAMGASPGRLAVSDGSLMMVHEAWGSCAGDAREMQAMADVLDKASENIASVYARRTGLPAASWRTAMKRETWYTAAEAVAAGLADRVA